MTEPSRPAPIAIPVWRRFLAGWRRLGRAVGDIQARLLLSLFYFLVLGPFALALRALADPLSLKPGTPRGWRERRSCVP